jgi:hypothetical protein
VWLSVAIAFSVHAIPTAFAQVSPRPDDRLVVSANGSTFSDGGGSGGGGAVTWVHPFSAGTLLGVGAEHQTITGSQWTFGTLMGSVTLGAPSGSPTTFNGEVHEGSGDIFGKRFTYSVAAVGVDHTMKNGLTLQLEERQIDVDTSHGSLPKIGVVYAWTPQLRTTVNYAQSIGGNLGTEISTARLDFLGKRAGFLAGDAYGQSVPVVVNLEARVEEPHFVLKLKEAFVGVSRSFSRFDVQLVADYVELAYIRRTTLTVIFNVPLR